MDLLNNRKALVMSAAAALATILCATMAYRALSVREPPMEAAGDGGLRIRLVEPPKAPFKAGGLLEVGVPGMNRDRATSRGDTVAPTRPRRVALDPDEDRVGRVEADSAIDAASDAADLADRQDAWEERRAREDRWAQDEERRDAEIDAERYGPSVEDWRAPPDEP